jgi:hypothetical protein
MRACARSPATFSESLALCHLKPVVCATVIHLVSAYYQRVLDHVLGALFRVEFTTDGNQVVD